jgi:hypothetical protein
MTEKLNEALSASYFQEAVTLRLCLESNLADYNFAKSGGRIVYIMDANVVVFFLNPRIEPRHVRLFSGTPAENLAATAIVTAEFLFSRGLAGQSGYPPLLAPSHAEDLWDVCDGILRRSRDTRSSISNLSYSTREKLGQLLGDVQQGRIPTQRAAAVLLRDVPEAAAILSDELRELSQLLRLSKNDMIRPLSVHPDATEDILSVFHAHRDEVVAWTRRISRERGHQDSSRVPTRQRTHGTADRRSQRDAEALVQTIVLDGDARNEGSNIRYVLVTADRALFDSYASWYWDEGVQRRERFVLRMPQQYAPILNVLEMPNGIEDSDIIQRTSLALDTLLAPLRSADPHRYPQNLSLLRILARLTSNNEELQKTITEFYDGNPFQFKDDSMELFEQIKTEWRQAFDAGVVLNAELIGRRMREEFEPLALLLRSDADLFEYVQKFQKDAIEHLARAHLLINTRVSIKRLMEDVPPAVSGYRGRAPLIVRSRFHQILPEKSLHEALDEIARREDLELLNIVDHELQGRMNYETWFFAACVAYRCGRWNTALQHAATALDLLTVESAEMQRRERDEIVFIIAAATRYALPDRGAITRALELLIESITTGRERNDQFSVTRALGQRCALVLHLLYRDYFLSGDTPTVLRDLGVDTLLQDFRDDLGGAVYAYEQMQVHHSNSFETYAREILRKQVWANIISADLLANITRSEYEFASRLAPPASLAKRALDELSVILEDNPYPIISTAELIMVKYYRRLVTRSDAKKLIREANHPPGGSSEILTDLDQAEFASFEAILDGGRSGPTISPSQPEPVTPQ